MSDKVKFGVCANLHVASAIVSVISPLSVRWASTRCAGMQGQCYTQVTQFTLPRFSQVPVYRSVRKGGRKVKLIGPRLLRAGVEPKPMDS